MVEGDGVTSASTVDEERLARILAHKTGEEQVNTTTSSARDVIARLREKRGGESPPAELPSLDLNAIKQEIDGLTARASAELGDGSEGWDVYNSLLEQERDILQTNNPLVVGEWLVDLETAIEQYAPPSARDAAIVKAVDELKLEPVTEEPPPYEPGPVDESLTMTVEKGLSLPVSGETIREKLARLKREKQQ
jgi:hypothetical protein